MPGGKTHKVDLSILRLAALGNVEIAHDLDARRQRRTVGVWQLHIGGQNAILAKTDAHLALAGIGLNVDVRGALAFGINDHGVDHAHQGIVGLLDLRLKLFIGIDRLQLKRLAQQLRR